MKETPGPFACAGLEMDFRDESALVELLERYLDGRATRFPATVKRRSCPGGGLAAWPSATPLFVGADGDRITRGTLQYRVLRAFRRAGIDADRARHGTAGTRRWIRRPRSRRRRRRPCRSACSPSSRIAARDRSGALRGRCPRLGRRERSSVGVTFEHRLEASKRQALRRRLEADYGCMRLRKR